MAKLEYSAERHIQYEKEDSYNSGYDTGYNTGYDSGLTSGVSTGVKNTTDLFSWIKKNGRESDILNAIDDPEFLNKLFDEFSESK